MESALFETVSTVTGQTRQSIVSTLECIIIVSRRGERLISVQSFEIEETNSRKSGRSE